MNFFDATIKISEVKCSEKLVGQIMRPIKKS